MSAGTVRQRLFLTFLSQSTYIDTFVLNFFLPDLEGKQLGRFWWNLEGTTVLRSV